MFKAVNYTNIFTKEALLLRQITSRNVVKNFVFCETLIGITMGHLEFSFIKEESQIL